MTPHPHQLYAAPFTEADQARLAGFSCGAEPWSRHVAEWLLGSDVCDSIRAFSVSSLRSSASFIPILLNYPSRMTHE